MRISATAIRQWAETREAQADLPRLIRRLAMQSGTITQIAFPAGESVNLPGWDGEILSTDGDAWVPAGKSCWELSVEAKPTAKANRDYDKRTIDTSADIRLQITLIVVTARRWAGKKAWRDEKRQRGEWRSVLAYDADDLEAWLEANPAIALDLADELGLTGDGVESAAHYWRNWSSQSAPPILQQAFLTDRLDTRERFLADLRRLTSSEARAGSYAIRADSAEEAVAFVCACLLDAPDLADQSLLVSAASGWRFVEKHPQIKIAVAAGAQIAEHAPIADVIVVVPVAAGDLASGYGSKTGNGFDLILKRPGIYPFREALVEIGIEETDAGRLANTTGRSWTVLRRRLAANPAIRNPNWLRLPESDVLTVLCLVGAWNTKSDADRSVIEQLSRASYESVEHELLCLSRADDPPVLRIGHVWHAKSPLELLELFAERITSAQLDRFFETAEALLVEPDPKLELPADKRWMAQVYGKVRAESGLLFQSICDTLIKFSVRGGDYPALATQSIDQRVASLVERLLGDADETRWLSLASNLRPLAEAAPSTFLKAIEASLNRPGTPVTILFRESTASDNSISGGYWWYTDLLWALETLAWSAKWISRVVLILGHFARIPLPGNWGNSPLKTLVNIYRVWLPQTAASLEQRIDALDRLIQDAPDIGFELLDQLIGHGPDMAFPSVTPAWRDDNAGAGGRSSSNDCRRMLIAAADRLITLSEYNAERLARTLTKLDALDQQRADKVLTMATVYTSTDASDEHRELLRSALRKKLHWHLNYHDGEPSALVTETAAWQRLYDALEPVYPVLRHRWLFQNGLIELPIASRRNRELALDTREQWRKTALNEIYRNLGMAGVERLAACCGDSMSIGQHLIEAVADDSILTDWIVRDAGDFAMDSPLTSLVCGIVRFMKPESAGEFLQQVIAAGQSSGWSQSRIARFLQLAIDEPSTWDIVDGYGSVVQTTYWSNVRPFYLTEENRDYAVSRLLNAQRPRTALQACQHELEKLSPKLLATIMDAIIKGAEPDGPMPDAWHLNEVFKRLESWDEMDRDQLIHLEFQFVPAFHLDGVTQLTALYQAVTSRHDLFTDLICLLYRPENAADDVRQSTVSESERFLAKNAWNVLHHCRRQPGTQPDGEIDINECTQFIDEARQLCQQRDRATLGDQTLGQILAHAPAGEDDVWPGLPARDILNRPELEAMRAGFRIGAINKRGMTSRAPDEGGNQERTLAQSYLDNAEAMATSHPYLAETLRQLAQHYQADARREDDEAGLRRERY